MTLRHPPTEAPRPHEGVHYDNPSSKPLEGPVAKVDQDGTQRFAWKLFFILIFCVLAMGAVLGLVTRQP